MKKILLFFYFGGAGGKFIANCLSYSRQVAFSEYQIALKTKQDNNIELLNLEILKTIPDKNKSRQWFNHEQGCTELFGPNIDRIKRHNPLRDLQEDGFFNIDLSKPMWLPIMTHSMSEFESILDWFKNDQIFTILVDSQPKFIDHAIRLKWPEQHHCLDLDAYKIFQAEVKSLNFDFVFNQWNPLTTIGQNRIIELAKEIKIEFDLDLAKNYINKYVEFHT